MRNVDDSRFNLIDTMSQSQKDMFLIGMFYHSAYLTMLEVENGWVQPTIAQLSELKGVIEAMKRQGLKSELTEWDLGGV